MATGQLACRSATTELSVDSITCGGDMNLNIGYRIAPNVAIALVPNR